MCCQMTKRENCMISLVMQLLMEVWVTVLKIFQIALMDIFGEEKAQERPKQNIIAHKEWMICLEISLKVFSIKIMRKIHLILKKMNSIMKMICIILFMILQFHFRRLL